MINKTQAGLSLIGLSVLLLLISISLTGVVSTLLKSQQLTKLSIQELDVLFLVANLASKMQLNKAQALSKNSRYLITLDQQRKLSGDCLGLKNCVQQQQALHHLNDFQQSLAVISSEYAVIICRDQTFYQLESLGHGSCDEQHDSPLVIKVWWGGVKNTDQPVGFYALSTVL